MTSLDGKTLHAGLPPIPGADSPLAPGWRAVGSAKVSTSTESPLNGEKCKLVKTSGQPGGLAQQPMKIHAGEIYRGSLWTRGEAVAGLRVQLLDGDTILAKQTLPAPRAQWKELPIVVNIGTLNWNRDVQDNDFLQEALDWIDYCNGPADSKWGSVRAANRHPEPYNVKYWEIDNETWHMGAEAYAAAVSRFGAAMRNADPSIKLLACGSGGYNQDWNRTVIHQSGNNFDYISTHHYEAPNNYARGPAKDEAFYRDLKSIIDAGPNPEIKVYCSEWNAQSTDWRTGLYCGGILNVFERCGDFLEIGGPALFLRHVSASAWDNAFVNFDHRTWFPAPNYVVMKLWQDHYEPHRIDLEGDMGDLNVVATKSQDGKTICIKAVNPTEETVNVKTELSGGTIGQASMQLVAPGALDARNTLDQRDKVKPDTAPVEKDGKTLRFSLPPISCGVIEIRCE